MSHNPHETIICPNCGYHASYNYCAECGQETHLHKETFLGLIAHFIGHYFHYDSKFWKTMKLLWFHPGALTIAYAKKQRNRFIPPISLYIFISFVFFFTIISFSHNSGPSTEDLQQLRADSARIARNEALMKRDSAQSPHYKTQVKNSLLNASIRLNNIDSEKNRELTEKMNHMVPKFFFFMIPLMAVLLNFLFFRRKDLYFVDHAVFSLHYHSFWFSAMLLAWLDPFANLVPWLSSIIGWLSVMGVTVYFVFAIRNVYKASWLKSILSALSISIVYLIVLIAVFVASTYYFAET
ncbi:DUF3667 domain-containing protein [Taibaiella soli]|nr:DUF3667 domain-containing protein [Taibaiella soli]